MLQYLGMKIPADARCEAGVLDYSEPSPVIRKCGKPATHAPRVKGITAYLCDGCFEDLAVRRVRWFE